uniref:Uncharacterized protein n=1 Tax=Arundo donax TaxID=35708 RepID=A0A0A9GME6_ARUDO
MNHCLMLCSYLLQLTLTTCLEL